MTTVYDSSGVPIFSGSAANAVPTLSSISPVEAFEGTGDTVVTLTGTNFLPSSVAKVDGSDRATTYISSTSMTVIVLEADLASPAALEITVFTPAPGGGLTSAQTFTVLAEDPYFSSVTLLIRGKLQDDEDTDVNDESDADLTIVNNGNTKWDTALDLWGDSTPSLLFDGTDDNLQIAHIGGLFPFWNYDEDFTMEGWFYLTDITGVTNNLCTKRPTSGNTDDFIWQVGDDGRVVFLLYNNSTAIISLVSSTGSPGGVTLSEDTWYHIAVDREYDGMGNSTCTLYVNGTIVDQEVQTANGSSDNDDFYIGNDPVITTRDYEGSINSFRITEGVARYAGSSFTPPTTHFPSQ